ncbi:MAG: UDP-N-acetylglucosamine 2-epimerase (non-hydrolyzing) [bacterium]|nr:UDP-N-acetylglucosamine 2-epimerase (non-hydrolyzing) [bacterium]
MVDGVRKFRISVIVGARPNFMKAAPILRAFKKYPQFDVRLIHTGQHYDSLMSDVFFRDLGLPKPHISLGVGSGSHAKQTARIMLASEDAFYGDGKPLVDMVMVVGDVNSTLATALTAKKLNIPVVHVEAGLRSGDETMPEEINRRLTDHISDLLFTTEKSGNNNLAAEGISPSKVHLVGNVMIDSLVHVMPVVDKSTILDNLSLDKGHYAVLTLHRPSNVDSKESVYKILNEIYAAQVSMRRQRSTDEPRMPIIFPTHPRTKERLHEFGLLNHSLGERLADVKIIEPLGYVDFVRLVKDSAFVMTDSGGIQEETTYLGVPCMTLRNSTERPSTLNGTNRLVSNLDFIHNEVAKILSGGGDKGVVPEFWDGKAAERIVDIVFNKYGSQLA